MFWGHLGHCLLFQTCLCSGTLRKWHYSSDVLGDYLNFLVLRTTDWGVFGDPKCCLNFQKAEGINISYTGAHWLENSGLDNRCCSVFLFSSFNAILPLQTLEAKDSEPFLTALTSLPPNSLCIWNHPGVWWGGSRKGEGRDKREDGGGMHETVCLPLCHINPAGSGCFQNYLMATETTQLG